MVSVEVFTPVLLVVFLQLSAGTVTTGDQGARLLEPGQIGFRSQSWIPGYYWVEATDGKVALKAAVSRDHGLIACSVNYSESAVRVILRDPGVTLEIIGKKQVEDMWRRCLQTGTTHYTKDEQSFKRAAAPAAAAAAAAAAATTPALPSNTPFPPELNTGTPEGPGAHVAIVPGTKWCGKGNVATSYDDLGEKVESDKCCRTHDHCPYYIPALTYKYNYNNLKPWTLSWCPCDTDLYNCLKATNTTSSNDVGEVFFGVLGMQCFDFEVGTYCAELHWTHLSCNTWATGPMAVSKDFPKYWDPQPEAPIGRR